ncbi:hypothetical protein [Streptomyces sp. XD-27]|uniref:hypothetical protein n=1 Tax=Streptomyces sp. XD-27 TaxID=3062779 RepID=UPI0026F4306E|nr:hypothetical protein [Streptomyces sp. XD-27]WKX73796.1 hypothetical protein Q3Y56_31495 [Streptomyces sp. XD-27]
MVEARSPVRLVRAALFAAVCVLLAAVGHAATSGHHIPPSALLAAFGVTGATAWLAGGRRRGVLAIGGGLLAVQGGVHLIFAGGQGAVTQGAHATHGAHARHAAEHAARHATHPPDPAILADRAESAMGATGYGSTAMLTVHLLAALLCALWLWRGEAAFFQLLRCVRALAFTPLSLAMAAIRPWATAPSVPPPARYTGDGRLRSALLGHALSRRGPPPTSAVFLHTAPVGPQAQGT